MPPPGMAVFIKLFLLTGEEFIVMALKNEISTDGNTLIIFIENRFDISTYSDFGDAYKDKMGTVSSIIIDMMDCSYMDSSALGMLLMMRERFCTDVSKNIFLRNMNSNVKKILLTANFDKLFKIES
jgi:anti-anti-sigma factor